MTAECGRSSDIILGAFVTLPEDKCEHLKVMPKNPGDDWFFKATTEQVRKEHPRFYGMCPDCGWFGVLYCSYAQLIAGDY